MTESEHENKKKIHPWRLCPAGGHWVRTHTMHVSPSKEHPEGYETTRHEHCARNPSGKDQLYVDEIKEIATRYFVNLPKKPCPIDLGFHKIGNQFDDIIAGWVQYWNDFKTRRSTYSKFSESLDRFRSKFQSPEACKQEKQK